MEPKPNDARLGKQRRHRQDMGRAHGAFLCHHETRTRSRSGVGVESVPSRRPCDGRGRGGRPSLRVGRPPGLDSEGFNDRALRPRRSPKPPAAPLPSSRPWDSLSHRCLCSRRGAVSSPSGLHGPPPGGDRGDRFSDLRFAVERRRVRNRLGARFQPQRSAFVAVGRGRWADAPNSCFHRQHGARGTGPSSGSVSRPQRVLFAGRRRKSLRLEKRLASLFPGLRRRTSTPGTAFQISSRPRSTPSFTPFSADSLKTTGVFSFSKNIKHTFLWIQIVRLFPSFGAWASKVVYLRGKTHNSKRGNFIFILSLSNNLERRSSIRRDATQRHAEIGLVALPRSASASNVHDRANRRDQQP